MELSTSTVFEKENTIFFNFGGMHKYAPKKRITLSIFTTMFQGIDFSNFMGIKGKTDLEPDFFELIDGSIIPHFQKNCKHPLRMERKYFVENLPFRQRVLFFKFSTTVFQEK